MNTKTQKRGDEKIYSAPQIELTEICVEKGFASSEKSLRFDSPDYNTDGVTLY